MKLNNNYNETCKQNKLSQRFLDLSSTESSNESCIEISDVNFITNFNEMKNIIRNH